jgi:hypothetical protein
MMRTVFAAMFSLAAAQQQIEVARSRRATTSTPRAVVEQRARD